jgi:hypothetical protein
MIPSSFPLCVVLFGQSLESPHDRPLGNARVLNDGHGPSARQKCSLVMMTPRNDVCHLILMIWRAHDVEFAFPVTPKIVARSQTFFIIERWGV